MSSTLIVQLDMRTLCQEADVTADCVIEIVEHGIVEPSGRTPEDWLFDDQAPLLAKRAAKLHQGWSWSGKGWRWRWSCCRKCSSCAARTAC
jgi:hypothetical protein